MTTAIDSTNGASLAVRDYAPDLAPQMVVSLSDLRDNLRQLEEFKRDIMVPEVDYGTIPGTPKPTLLKPGAEKLSLAFGLAPSFEHANRIEDWDRGFFHYEERCILTSRRSGQIVATANGSANIREPRYRWRDAKPQCPDCGFELRRQKRRTGQEGESGWYCWAKIGGCGQEWPAETVKVVGRIENPEPWELANTILKMAQKRALIAAALIATGGSGIWTQDVEDMPSVSGDAVIAVPPHVPLRERDVEDAPRRPQGQQQSAPRNLRQAVAQQTLKPTTTPCSVDGCGRMVESEGVLKAAHNKYGKPLCSAHFNQAQDAGKSPAESAEELPL